MCTTAADGYTLSATFDTYVVLATCRNEAPRLTGDCWAWVALLAPHVKKRFSVDEACVLGRCGAAEEHRQIWDNQTPAAICLLQRIACSRHDLQARQFVVEANQ